MQDERLIDALEALVVSGVGLTANALEAAAPAVEITLQQWRALSVIARADGIRTGEVARRVGVAVPSASRLIRRLERRGLVATSRDERDRRATLVRPTADGRALWAALVDERRGRIADALASMDRPVDARTIEDLGSLRAAFARFD